MIPDPVCVPFDAQINANDTTFIATVDEQAQVK